MTLEAQARIVSQRFRPWVQGQMWSALPIEIFVQAVGSGIEYSGLRALLRSGQTLGASLQCDLVFLCQAECPLDEPTVGHGRYVSVSAGQDQWSMQTRTPVRNPFGALHVSSRQRSSAMWCTRRAARGANHGC